MSELLITKNQYLELEKLGIGAFSPLSGFMNQADFNAVVNTMRLNDGTPFPVPIILDVSEKIVDRVKRARIVSLVFENEEVGQLEPDGFYSPDKHAAALKIFGTNNTSHPGVALFLSLEKFFIGGPVRLIKRPAIEYPDFEITPKESKKLFSKLGMKTVAGFQTRNVPHRAHEYLQRVALEHVDGLFIQPLVGYKKKGDYTTAAVIKGYQALIENFYPKEKVILGTLSTAMRYAGPREAVFHAIVRRNYGCSHFIVGRDHAGVGNYYGKYDAHALTESFGDELGIKIMRLHGPYYCKRCDGIVTEQTCRHEKYMPEEVTHISGTDMRAMLEGGLMPNKNLMRPEIIEALSGVHLFI